MFDLHMHTTLSDGILSVDELVSRLKKEGITLFAITDHNHALAYENLDTQGLRVIAGSELATSYKGRIIEFLGYHINPQIINDWYHDFYSDENLAKNETQLFHDLKACAAKQGFKIPDSLEMGTMVKGVSKKTIYNYLSEHEENFGFSTYKEFFRKGMSKPDSPWFIDEGRFYPSPQETIDLIHKAGGYAIIAHPHEYGFSDNEELFRYCQNLGIDGIECFHPSASMVQSVAIANYCCEHGLKGSGGSDFHRDGRGAPLGVHANHTVLEKPCFDWFLREKI